MKNKSESLALACLFLFLLLISSAYAARIHGTIYDMELNELKGVVVEIDTSPQQRMVSKDSRYEFNVPEGDYKIKAAYSHELGAQEDIMVKKDGDYVFDLFLSQNFEEEDQLLEDINIPISDKVFDTQNRVWVYIIISALFILIIVIFFRLLRKKEGRNKKEDKDKKQHKGSKRSKYAKSGAKPSLSDRSGKTDRNDKTNRHNPHDAAKSTAAENEITAGHEATAEDEMLRQAIEIIKKNDNRMTQKDLRKELPFSEAKISLLVAQLESEGKIKKIKKGRGNILILN